MHFRAFTVEKNATSLDIQVDLVSFFNYRNIIQDWFYLFLKFGSFVE